MKIAALANIFNFNLVRNWAEDPAESGSAKPLSNSWFIELWDNNFALFLAKPDSFFFLMHSRKLIYKALTKTSEPYVHKWYGWHFSY